MPAKKLNIEERFADQSRRIRMLEEVFMPMAKTAMNIISGENGKPGMAEDLRNVRSEMEKLIQAYAEDKSETMTIRKNGFDRLEVLENRQQIEKEVKLLGMKVSAEAKIAFINGMFILLSSLIALWVSK